MTSRLRHVVVVGNGIAGLTAGDALRGAGYDGELTIVGAERHRPYSRPALSKAALLDSDEMTSHLLPEPEHEGQELLGTSATALDTARRVVQLSTGEHLPYDGLVVASGSHARRFGGPPDRNAPTAQLTLRGVDDAIELRRRIVGRPSVIVVGGGPLGMEVASGCAALGCRVTHVSRHTPMTTQVGPFLAEVFASEAVRAGVVLRFGADIAVRDEGNRAIVTIDGESDLAADLLVCAIGDIPNTRWLDQSGVLTAGLLRVDTRGRVRSNIVAAGDVAAFPTSRGVRRVPLWTSAIEQAKIAALGLLLGDEAPELAFQPYFWTEQFGLNARACGELPVHGAPEVIDGDLEERRALLRWSHHDGAGTAVSLNYRMPVPRLRALSRSAAVTA